MKKMFAIITIAFSLLFNSDAFAQMAWVAPKYSNDIKNPLKDNKDATSKGKKIFSNMCMVCHGATGKGNGVAGVSLVPRPANFLSIEVRNETDGAIFWKLTEGKPPMAAYKDLLTEDQRWELVNYIRHLEATNKK